MRRAAVATAVLVSLVIGLGACGLSSKGSTSGGTGASALACPTTSTTSFVRLRFATDIGLVAGSFHQWIWAPYRKGSFAKGVHGRAFSLTKAAATAVFIDHEVKAAASDLEASPRLCQAIGKPLGSLETSIGPLGSALRHGDVGSLPTIDAGVATVLAAVRSHGIAVTEQHAG
jgi:hypothetical protein